MGNRKISNDAKVISLRLRERGLDSRREILKIVGFSQATYYHTICRKEATGSVAKAKVLGRGRPRRLLHSDSQYLVRLARHKPTLFLDEYADHSAYHFSNLLTFLFPYIFTQEYRTLTF